MSSRFHTTRTPRKSSTGMSHAGLLVANARLTQGLAHQLELVAARSRELHASRRGVVQAQDEQLNGFGRGCPAQQRQPAEEPEEDQVEQA